MKKDSIISRKQKHREINPKADGRPYVEKFNEEYAKMTPEERAKVDETIAELDKILGDDDE